MNSEKQFTEKPHCYAILTAEVRYDTELSSTAKLLYAEITALFAKEGYCFASNAYFERLYNVSERQIIRLLNLLEQKGYQNSKPERHRRKKNIFDRAFWDDKNVSSR